jgi:glycosylphosphatidylinositol transamidase
MQVFMSLCVPLTLNRQAVDRAALSSLLKAFNLCLASTVITVVSLLNFSLAALLAVLLAVPLSISGRSASTASTAARAALYVMLATGWVLAKADVLAALRNWELYGAWFAPFVCAVYVPLVMQALTATLL